MEDNDSEKEIFEITDFTNASPWESFVAEIENILIQWGLTSSVESVDLNQSYCEQHLKSERLSYAKHTFVISLHVSGEKKRPSSKQSDQDWPDGLVCMMNPNNDFPLSAHHITRWYGVEQFVLIAPDEKSEALTSEAQSKLMISSISLAVHNAGCTTPIFVQVQKHWRHMYTGVCEGNGLRTNFETVHLKKTPAQFDHLAGMIDLFRSKIGKVSTIKQSSIDVSARITYYLRHWRVEDWPVEPLGEFKGGVDEEAFSKLPLGATIDPVQELHLSAQWSGLSDDTVIDNGNTSGFDPMYAPLWTVKTHLVDNPGLILNDLVHDFTKLCYRQESIEDLLGNKLMREDMRSPGVGSSDFSHALTRLTGPSSTITSFSSVMYSSSARLEFGSEFEPISDEELDAVLQYIFPDSSPTASYQEPPSFHEDRTGRRIKSAHPDSFTASLARVLCIVNKEYGLKAFAHVWYEVILELRYRWENGIPITKIGTESPDMTACLLHQKLQMLNCCIHHKISHARRGTSSSPSPSTHRTSLEPDYHTPSSSLSYSQRISSQLSHEDGKESVTTGTTVAMDTTVTTDTAGSSSDDEFYEALETPTRLTEESSESRLERSIRELSMDSDTFKTCPSPNLKPKAVDLKPVEMDPLSLPVADSNESTPPTVSKRKTGEAKEEVPITRTRQGALKQYKDLVLIRTGEPLYVPETQDPAPLTEDMLLEQQHVLSTLGTNEEATQVRAKMQSMSLVSDMQSFKAANPGCILEDFVRWYSPRDWMEGGEEEEEEGEGGAEESNPTDGWEEEEWKVELESDSTNDDTNTSTFVSGHLSIRMRQDGNMWVESWENATPIPVYRQKRLFDDTKEAEKVLHYLSGLKLFELSMMLLPVILHSAIIAINDRLKSMPLSGCESLVTDSLAIMSTVQQATSESLPVYQECLSLIQQAEHQLAIANSLSLKLHQGLEIKSRQDDGTSKTGSKEISTSVQILAQDKQELVLREPTTSLTGIALQGLLVAQQAVQNAPHSHHGQNTGIKAAAREFILRTVCAYPGSASTQCPHRMFCLLSKDEMRLAGAFSEDVLLF